MTVDKYRLVHRGSVHCSSQPRQLPSLNRAMGPCSPFRQRHRPVLRNRGFKIPR